MMNLFEASQVGNLERVKLLLGQQTIDKDGTDRSGYTAMWRAAQKGHLAIVQVLVEQGADMDKMHLLDTVTTPLSTASFNGHLNVVQYLLEQGADRDKVNYYGSTPLHWAAQNGHLEIAMLLMSYGADLNARNKLGLLPIDVALTEEIKQAIRDEPRRRMDEAPGKRATEQDRHPNAAISASAQEGEEEEGEEQQISKKPRLDEGGDEAEKGKVAEEDEDSEPSSDEDGDD